MAHVLKMLQLAQHHGVAQMNIRRRGIHAEIHAQRLSGLSRDFSSFAFSSSSRMISADAFRMYASCSFDRFEFADATIFSPHSPQICQQHAPAFDAIAPFEHDAHGLGINAMLFAQDALGERFRRVAILDGHHRLQHDRPCVQIFVHEMHGAARKFRAVFERLALRFEPRETRATATDEYSGCDSETPRTK